MGKKKENEMIGVAIIELAIKGYKSNEIAKKLNLTEAEVVKKLIKGGFIHE